MLLSCERQLSGAKLCLPSQPMQFPKSPSASVHQARTDSDTEQRANRRCIATMRQDCELLKC